MKKLGLITISAVGIFVLAGCEQPEVSPLSLAIEAQRDFDQADANKDGVVTRGEAESVANLDFGTADTDGNEALSPQEFEVAALETAAAAPPG